MRSTPWWRKVHKTRFSQQPSGAFLSLRHFWLAGESIHPCQAAPPVLNTTRRRHHLIQKKNLFLLAQARRAVWRGISLMLLTEPLLRKSPKVLFPNISFDVSRWDFLVPELAYLVFTNIQINPDQIRCVYSIPHGVPVPRYKTESISFPSQALIHCGITSPHPRQHHASVLGFEVDF